MPPVQEHAEQLADELLENLADLTRGDEAVAASARARIVAVVTPYLDAPAIAATQVKEAAATASSEAADAAAEVLVLRGQVAAAAASIRSALSELPDLEDHSDEAIEADARRQALTYAAEVLAPLERTAGA